MKIRIASWNVNSIRVRQNHLARVDRRYQPDVMCLQETKAADVDFPLQRIKSLGYEHVALACALSTPGVAILSRLPFAQVTRRDWCGRADNRYLQVRLANCGLEVHNFYVPAGGDEPDAEANPKFAHKLAFLDEAAGHFRGLRAKTTAKRILLGDLNVAPLEHDVWSHKKLARTVTHTPVEIEHLARLMKAGGWVDAMRRFVPEDEKLYTWWSYRGGGNWQKADRGRRLDHIWVSPALESGLARLQLATDTRGWKRPSDHVPVILDLEV